MAGSRASTSGPRGWGWLTRAVSAGFALGLGACLPAANDLSMGTTADASSDLAGFDPGPGLPGDMCRFEGERFTQPPQGPAQHSGMPAGGWSTNPPSSGPHCPEWGRYTTYPPTRPLPRCNYLHNLEHGAVVLAYNCPQGCPTIVTALQTLVARGPTDPDCPAKRIIITPDRELDTSVAGAAWGYTWRSGCLDQRALDSLATFIREHLGSRGIAPEGRVCVDGTQAP